LNFENKIAFITGEVKGIERATVVALSAFGYKVITNNIDPNLLRLLKKDIDDLLSKSIEI
tara:strand:+ start:599 stop:778 length:180 start_codon:yes stop_codon:yes gene_type:complete